MRIEYPRFGQIGNISSKFTKLSTKHFTFGHLTSRIGAAVNSVLVLKGFVLVYSSSSDNFVVDLYYFSFFSGQMRL